MHDKSQWPDANQMPQLCLTPLESSKATGPSYSESQNFQHFTPGRNDTSMGILLTCTSKIFSLLPPTHLRLHYSLTPPTYSLAPPTYSLAPPLPSHFRLTTFPLAPTLQSCFWLKCLRYFFPQCHDLKPGLLFKLHPPLPSTNAII